MYLTSRKFQLLLFLAVFVSGVSAAKPQNEIKYLNDSIPRSWMYDSQFNQTVPIEDNWWKNFNDPILDKLIEQGVNNNYNLAMAARRIEVANNQMKAAKGGYLPSVGLTAGWEKDQSSGLMYGRHGKASRMSYFSLGLNASWEVDLFGKINSKVKEAKAQLQVSKAEYAGAMIALCAQIATDYIQLRTWQTELAIANEHIDSQAKIVKLTEARKEAGLASALDVAQALIVYNSTKATIPSLENSIHTAMNSIAILIGVYPDDVYEELSLAKPLPDYIHIVGVGIPMELLRRRPDVVEAEAELAEYAAEIGIAKKDFLPTLTITGAIGTSAHNGKDLFSKESFTYSIAPTLSWTIFDGFQRKYNLANAREQMQIGIDNYNLTVMTAVEETDNAMSSYLSSLREITAINEVIVQSRRARDLSVDLYKRGLNPFSDVVSAQMSLLQYQNQEASSRGDALTALVNLYEALGGGWDVSQIQ